MKRMILAAVLASAVAVSGCGGNQDQADAEAEKAKTAISAYLVEERGAAGMELKKQEADCISDGMVEGVGVDQLKKYGLLKQDGTVNKKAESPDLSQQDAEVVVDSMFECTDVMATMKKQMAQVTQNADPKTRKCVEDALGESVVRKVLVASFSGKREQAQQELMGPMAKCLTPGSGSGN